MFSLEKRRLKGYLINVYLKGGGRQMDASRLFLVVCGNRTKSNGLKPEHRKFHANMEELLYGKADKALEQAANQYPIFL